MRSERRRPLVLIAFAGVLGLVASLVPAQTVPNRVPPGGRPGSGAGAGGQRVDPCRGAGGTYLGPSGGGSPGYEGPVGGGSGQPEPGQGGGPSGGGSPGPGPTPGPGPGPQLPPANQPPNAPPTGTTPRPPVGPLPSPPSGPPLPPGLPVRHARGLTTPHGLPFATERWENWWILNRDRYLDLTQTFGARARGPETAGDAFLGEVLGGEPAAPVVSHHTEVRRRLIPELSRLLQDPSALIRGEAALALGKVGGLEEVSLLVSGTTDNNRFVRQFALLGLGLLREPEAGPYLSSYLLRESEQDHDRAFAALALAILGEVESLPALATILNRQHEERNLTAAALYALGFVRDESAVLLLREYVDEAGNPGDLRAVATLALGKQGLASLVPRLLELLQDADSDVRQSAALALGEIDFESSLWARRDQLLLRLREWGATGVLSQEARRQFEGHLADIERRASLETRSLQLLERKAADALAQALDQDRDRMVRYFAAMSLGRLGSPEAREALLKAFQKVSGNEAGRGFVALALGIAGGRGALPELRRALVRKGMGPSSQSAAILALGLLGDQVSGEGLLQLALNDANPDVRSASALACGLMDHRSGREALREELRRETHSFLRPAMALALALLGDLETLDVLEGLLLGPSGSSVTRTQAAEGLASFHDLASLDALLRLIQSQDVTDLVRASAIHAAGQVAEKTVLPGLEPMARGWNYLLPFPAINDALLR